jgi:hypothetical protein
MPATTIDRKCHWLRRNRTQRRPEWILFVDGESDITPIHDKADLHTFRLGWACLCHYTPIQGLHVHGWYDLHDLLDFWHTISSLALDVQQLYIVSHNIDYDARVLHAFTILPGIGWSPSYIILGDSCHFFTFKADKAKISLLDNMNYWQMSLDALGQEFGIPKLEIDFETCTNAELSRYCHTDVEILVKVWRFWLAFLDEHKLGNWAITTAGQAWNAYRHRFMPAKIGIHNRADAIRLERESYRGGRCEVWKVGKFLGGPFYKLDINGLYSYVMREYPSPQKLVKVLVGVTPAYLEKLLERYMCIADVHLETDEPVYPLRIRGYNIFPTGTFRICLTTLELKYALAHGHIKAIGEVAIYERKYLFKAFINYFTPLRQKHKLAGETGRSLLCKMIRNSLYGKFGQRGYEQKVIDDAPLDKIAVRRWVDAETGERCTDWTFGGKTIRQHYKGESEDSFPAIASHIAAQGRMILWAYACRAGHGNVYYADTDSLIVNQAGYDALAGWIDPIKLGYLKIESQANDLAIMAKKSYVIGNKRTLKGIKKNATRTEDGKWKQTHFTSLKWAFASSSLEDVITYEVEKEEHDTLYHGRIDKKFNVIPPEFSLDADDVAKVVAPETSYAWTWWIDPSWFCSLSSHRRTPPLPMWYLAALQDEPVAALTF